MCKLFRIFCQLTSTSSLFGYLHYHFFLNFFIKANLIIFSFKSIHRYFLWHFIPYRMFAPNTQHLIILCFGHNVSCTYCLPLHIDGLCETFWLWDILRYFEIFWDILRYFLSPVGHQSLQKILIKLLFASIMLITFILILKEIELGQVHIPQKTCGKSLQIQLPVVKYCFAQIDLNICLDFFVWKCSDTIFVSS